MQNNMIRLAIQKSGRLSEGSLELLNDCGISVSNGIGRLMTQASNFPMEVLFLRDDDIPQYVQDGVADIGILGQNVVVEKERSIDEVLALGFSRCRLSLAIPKNENYNGPRWFEGKNIATSYPVILQQFLDANKVKASIHEISGSVEIAPGIGLAEGICDIVSSGSTLFSNGLKEVEVIFRSEAVLVANSSLSAEKKALLDKLTFRINAVRQSRNNKYVLLNAPDDKLQDIISILPGVKSPTIVPLAMKGWSSVHSVISEDKFWEIIDKLRDAGAQGILILPIEKMIV
ncbi:MAG TPA: ATP phosphoribosyltransferase [Flavobacteriales bacterium]|nr:ATP phosphoribosyltransferase [Flavobacteriales bacterium]HRJ37934.1 ATP phosphoribosyltransferase [Flavobacteriales bacterium]